MGKKETKTEQKDKTSKFYEKEIRKLKKDISNRDDVIYKLKLLIDVNSIIASSLDRKKVLKTILDQTEKLLNTKKASILLIDPALNQLVFEVFSNEKDMEKLSDVRLSMGEGIAGAVWENGKPLLIEDAQKDSRFCRKADEKTEYITTSVLAVPLISSGKIIGVMEAINKEDGSHFDHFDLELFQNLSVQAAVAIENANLYEMAISDGKTKLFIHRYFNQRVKEEFRRVERHGGELSLIMFDIDHFKKVNDVYGHQTGDEVLIKTAEIIKKNCRTTDIPCRFGGEEFAVILPETTKEGAYVYAEKIRRLVENMEIEINGDILKVTISAGISSMIFHSAKNSTDLLELADKALYLSKENGRNKVTIFS